MKITTEDIQVGFHARQILKGISIESKDKELVGIIGPNGSGKSTLLKCIYRILKPDAGAVYLDGEELHSMSVKSSARKMAVVAQHNYYNFDFTVREVVLMGRAPHKKALERDNAKDYRIVEEALKTVQMDAFADRTFSTLSGGEQQRVILARALAQQTPALILDEPTNHLDITHQIMLMELVKKLNVTVISAIHDLNIAAAYCDKIYVLKDGVLEGYGTPQEVRMVSKEKLFNFRRSSAVNLYSIGSFEDYFYGFMANHTGYIKTFDLFLYEGGFVLQLPTQNEPDRIPEFKPREKIFRVQKESQEWGDKLDIATVGDLNEKVTRGGIQDILLIQEAMQEAKISEIASEIAAAGNKKFVMIAGPSSSGKTTFSHRLSIQLAAHGMKPHPIAVDNYFIDRHLTPVDEFGEKNFECLEAIDVEQFNKDMLELLEGKRVEMPVFNFKTGTREYKGDFLQLDKDDILVIEGIHGLNDRLSYALPKESKFKIYLSALTQLNIDEHNRIPTTDGRLIRRIVRDARTRGTSAKETIARWPSVRRGEEQNIFPFQEDADVMFNSALIYELACLKVYAEPLLFGIAKDEPEYTEAKRLLKFFEYFVPVPSEAVPNNSILREFIGGSCFDV